MAQTNEHCDYETISKTRSPKTGTLQDNSGRRDPTTRIPTRAPPPDEDTQRLPRIVAGTIQGEHDRRKNTTPTASRRGRKRRGGVGSTGYTRFQNFTQKANVLSGLGRIRTCRTHMGTARP